MAAYREVWEDECGGAIRMPFGGSADFFTWSKDERGRNYNEVDERAIERCTLASAAPDLCRALLRLDHELRSETHGWLPCCRVNSDWPHHEDCYVVAALAKAGLDTQEKRDAARKELGL